MPRKSASRLSDASIGRLRKPLEGKRNEFPDAGAQGLIVRVTPSGRRDFMVRFRLGDRQNKIALGTWPALSLAEARQRAREVREQAAAGIDPRTARLAETARQRLGVETFGDLAERFLAEWSPRSEARQRWTAGTIRKHLAPLAPVRLADLHRSQLGDIVASIRDPLRLGGAKPGAARNAYEAAKRITAWAIRRGHLEHDPFAGAEPAPKGAPRDRVLSDAELALLWPAFGKVGYPFGDACRLLLLTGARRAEIGELRWSEVDDPDAPTVLRLPADRTKSGEARSVPLSAQAREVLAGVPRFSGLFVFSTRGGSVPVAGWTQAKRRLDALTAEAAEAQGTEPPEAWTFHDLRRTMRTGLARLRIPFEVAERAIGHAGGSALARTYDRFTYHDEIADALERWGREVARITGKPGGGKVVRLHRTR